MGALGAGVAFALLVVVTPGCKSSPVGNAGVLATLDLQLLPEDTVEQPLQPLPVWLERRFGGNNLFAKNTNDSRLKIRLLSAESPVHQAFVGLPTDAINRPDAGDGPLPVMRLQRPAATISMVGLDGRKPMGIAQARFDPAFLRALEAADSSVTLDEALWLALLGLDAEAVNRYARFASPASAAAMIQLRQQNILVSTLTKLDAAGLRFSAERWLQLDEAGLTAEEALDLRNRGVRADPVAMLIAAREAGSAQAEAGSAQARNDARTQAASGPVPAPAAFGGVPLEPARLRLPPTPVSSAPQAARAPASVPAGGEPASPAVANAGQAPAPAPSQVQAPAQVQVQVQAPAPAPALTATPAPASNVAPTPAPTRAPAQASATGPVPTPIPVAGVAAAPASVASGAASQAGTAAASAPAGEGDAMVGPAGEIAGVPARYAELMQRLGYTGEEQLQALFAARVEPRSVRDFLDAGHNPTAEELIAARRLGVDGAVALSLAGAGYTFNLVEVLELAREGVDVNYALGLVDARYPPLSKDQLLDLKRRGVTPEQVRAIRSR